MYREYMVTSRSKSLSFLNGYKCNSKSKEHFLSHLGYKFSKCCDPYQLKNAYESGNIIIDILTKLTIPNKKPKIINEFWSTYSYILEINYGGINNDLIEERSFVSDTEAYEWINSF